MTGAVGKAPVGKAIVGKAIVKTLIPASIRKQIRAILRAGQIMFVHSPRFERQLRKATPIFVYQMGKVGSSSVCWSLRRTYPGVVHHDHTCSPNHVNWQTRRLYQWAILERQPLYIISLTREPIGRNVSTFFQNFEREVGIPYDQSNFSVEELGDHFLANFNHEWPVHWFDRFMNSIFGIDVYGEPFPHCGYASFSRRNIQLLVIKSEIADDVKVKALKEFLKLKDLPFTNEHRSQDKDYGETYQSFKKHVKFPIALLTQLCESKYFTHFYNPEDRDAIIARWCKI